MRSGVFFVLLLSLSHCWVIPSNRIAMPFRLSSVQLRDINYRAWNWEKGKPQAIFILQKQTQETTRNCRATVEPCFLFSISAAYLISLGLHYLPWSSNTKFDPWRTIINSAVRVWSHRIMTPAVRVFFFLEIYVQGLRLIVGGSVALYPWIHHFGIFPAAFVQYLSEVSLFV